jgi:YjbE family integral membrane protein
LDSLLTFTQIMLVNLLLSGDNAVVIAMACRNLKPGVRERAMLLGTGAAIALRCLLTVSAAALLAIPFLRAVGALLLYAVAVKLLLDNDADVRSRGARGGATVADAIRTIIAADFVMSLDNVLAIAAIADGEIVLMLIGIALGIPIVVWGSRFVGALLDRVPILVHIGAALLGYEAGRMLVHDPGLDRLPFRLSPTAAEALPVLSAPLVITLWLLAKRLRFR